MNPALGFDTSPKVEIKLRCHPLTPPRQADALHALYAHRIKRGALVLVQTAARPDLPDIDSFCRVVEVCEEGHVICDYLGEDNVLHWGFRFKAPLEDVWGGMPEVSVSLYTSADDLLRYLRFMWPTEAKEIAVFVGGFEAGPELNCASLLRSARQQHSLAWFSRFSDSLEATAEVDGVGYPFRFDKEHEQDGHREYMKGRRMELGFILLQLSFPGMLLVLVLVAIDRYQAAVGGRRFQWDERRKKRHKPRDKVVVGATYATLVAAVEPEYDDSDAESTIVYLEGELPPLPVDSLDADGTLQPIKDDFTEAVEKGGGFVGPVEDLSVSRGDTPPVWHEGALDTAEVGVQHGVQQVVQGGIVEEGPHNGATREKGDSADTGTGQLRQWVQTLLSVWLHVPDMEAICLECKSKAEDAYRSATDRLQEQAEILFGIETEGEEENEGSTIVTAKETHRPTTEPVADVNDENVDVLGKPDAPTPVKEGYG